MTSIKRKENRRLALSVPVREFFFFFEHLLLLSRVIDASYIAEEVFSDQNISHHCVLVSELVSSNTLS